MPCSLVAQTEAQECSHQYYQLVSLTSLSVERENGWLKPNEEDKFVALGRVSQAAPIPQLLHLDLHTPNYDLILFSVLWNLNYLLIFIK